MNPGLKVEREARQAVLSEIERQASEAWGLGQAVCARDLLVVDAVPLSEPGVQKRKIE
jgi:hypothetical protein